MTDDRAKAVAMVARQQVAVSVFGTLFSSCNGSRWQKRKGWPPKVRGTSVAATLQRMHGVTMDDAVGTVVKLDLTNNNVIGQSLACTDLYSEFTFPFTPFSFSFFHSW